MSKWKRLDFPFQSPEKLVAILDGRQYIDNNGVSTLVLGKISSNFMDLRISYQVNCICRWVNEND